MSVLLIAGSPSERSRTAALLEAAGARLEARGVLVERLRVRDLSPQSLDAQVVRDALNAAD